jgi:serine/threonine protein kinase
VYGALLLKHTVAGIWCSHIPVAIKVLHRPVDELDPLMQEDFDREVSFMQTVRHPHVLQFLGAGVNAQDRAYLVTELMAKGSLKVLLRDTTQQLSWPTRLQFARDSAAGVRYLHEILTVRKSAVESHGMRHPPGSICPICADPERYPNRLSNTAAAH